jgi:hypothetical protein
MRTRTEKVRQQVGPLMGAAWGDRSQADQAQVVRLFDEAAKTARVSARGQRPGSQTGDPLSRATQQVRRDRTAARLRRARPRRSGDPAIADCWRRRSLGAKQPVAGVAGPGRISRGRRGRGRSRRSRSPPRERRDGFPMPSGEATRQTSLIELAPLTSEIAATAELPVASIGSSRMTSRSGRSSGSFRQYSIACRVCGSR